MPSAEPSSSPTLAYAVLCDLYHLAASNVSYMTYCEGGVPDMPAVCANSHASGITCPHTTTVTQCDMSNTGMTGTLPPTMGELGDMVELHLSGNNIESPLPASLTQLTALEVLNIGGNDLGTVRFFGFGEANGGNRRRLIEDNTSAALFASIVQLTKLKYLDISDNGLIGEVPDSLCALDLEVLHLMDPTNFSNPSTNEMGLQYQSAKANQFSCIPRCFHANARGISLAVDYDLEYCGQTGVPSSEPTEPNLSNSQSTSVFNTAEMSSLIVGLCLLLLLLLILAYYFCCYSNTKVKGRDEEIIRRASYVDFTRERDGDSKGSARHSERHTEFDSYIQDFNESEDDGSFESGEGDGFNYMNPAYRHNRFHDGNNLSDIEEDDEQSSSNPSHSLSSKSSSGSSNRFSFNRSNSNSNSNSNSSDSRSKLKKLTRLQKLKSYNKDKAGVDDDQDPMAAWNEELNDFHKGNPQVLPEVQVPEDYYNIDDVDRDISSDSGSDLGNTLVPYRERHNLAQILGDDESESASNSRDSSADDSIDDGVADDETFDTLIIFDNAGKNNDDTGSDSDESYQ